MATLFAVAFIAAGTTTAVYSLDIKRPLPPQATIAFVIVFGLLVLSTGLAILMRNVFKFKATKKHRVLSIPELEGAPVEVQDSRLVDGDGFELQELRRPGGNSHLKHSGNGNHKNVSSERYVSYNPSVASNSVRHPKPHIHVNPSVEDEEPISESRRGPYQMRANDPTREFCTIRVPKGDLRVRIPTQEELDRMNEYYPDPVPLTPLIEQHRPLARKPNVIETGTIRKARRPALKIVPPQPLPVSRPVSPLTPNSQRPGFNATKWDGKGHATGTESSQLDMSPVSPLTIVSDASILLKSKERAANAEAEGLLPRESAADGSRKRPAPDPITPNKAERTRFKKPKKGRNVAK
ncbi:hypothetical protein MMC14_000994 [Varicellaria rhodocarpa]|nr:hypothetical protein [Varicellaria rhodocarpa]